jgi:hypothetical protein
MECDLVANGEYYNITTTIAPPPGEKFSVPPAWWVDLVPQQTGSGTSFTFSNKTKGDNNISTSISLEPDCQPSGTQLYLSNDNVNWTQLKSGATFSSTGSPLYMSTAVYCAICGNYLLDPSQTNGKINVSFNGTLIKSNIDDNYEGYLYNYSLPGGTYPISDTYAGTSDWCSSAVSGFVQVNACLPNIKGTVTVNSVPGGAPMSYVQMCAGTYCSASLNQTSNYKIAAVPGNKSYTVAPVPATVPGYVVTPSYQNVSLACVNATGVDFTYNCDPSYIIPGSCSAWGQCTPACGSGVQYRTCTNGCGAQVIQSQSYNSQVCTYYFQGFGGEASAVSNLSDINVASGYILDGNITSLLARGGGVVLAGSFTPIKSGGGAV